MTDDPGNMLRWVSIDPGDLHVGFAIWIGEDCVDVQELTPDECVNALRNMAENGVLERVMYERFALQPDKAKFLLGNEFLTSQLIGQIKLVCRWYGVQCGGYLPMEHKRIYKMTWFKQLTWHQRRAMPYSGKGTPGAKHCMDAWCVGEWFVRQRRAGK